MARWAVSEEDDDCLVLVNEDPSCVRVVLYAADEGAGLFEPVAATDLLDVQSDVFDVDVVVFESGGEQAIAGHYAYGGASFSDSFLEVVTWASGEQPEVAALAAAETNGGGFRVHRDGVLLVDFREREVADLRRSDDGEWTRYLHLQLPRPMSNDGAPVTRAVAIAGIELVELVGEGGFGFLVFVAINPRFPRRRGEGVTFANWGRNGAPAIRAGVPRDGMLSSHPNIVTVYESGFTDTDLPYLVMEYLARGSLNDWIDRDGLLSAVDALVMGVRIAGVVETAHRAGVLHREHQARECLGLSLRRAQAWGLWYCPASGRAEDPESARDSEPDARCARAAGGR